MAKKWEAYCVAIGYGSKAKSCGYKGSPRPRRTDAMSDAIRHERDTRPNGHRVGVREVK